MRVKAIMTIMVYVIVFDDHTAYFTGIETKIEMEYFITSQYTSISTVVSQSTLSPPTPDSYPKYAISELVMSVVPVASSSTL